MNIWETTQTTATEPSHVFKRILVPLDGSTCAEEALPVAAHIARASNATIVLVRIVPLNSIANIQKADSYLQYIAANEALSGMDIHTELLKGNLIDTLINYAKQQQISLIVMCHHSNTGVKRWIVSSVAQQMLRQNSIPLLIMRQGYTSFFQQTEVQHRPFSMLVTLDGSILAETVLLPATWISATLSAPLRGKLHLLRIVQPTHQIDSRAGNIVRRINDQAIDRAKTYLERMEHLINQSELVPLHLDITSAVAFETDVAHTIMRVAEYGETIDDETVCHGYDSVALATHGRRGLLGWVAGSVAEKLLGSIRVPLLIVSHPHSSERQSLEEYPLS
jgi:nucleotide-binding universal stress UspA family protein